MPPLDLPVIQNWSCHNCSGCCRQHLIELSEEERERIRQQGWTEADGIPAGQPVLERMSRNPLDRRYRLAHQADGACVFLRADGLCRIHAKFGEAAKPLACRVYPYAFHPAGPQVAVSLRFSCPSVVANRGVTLIDQRQEIGRIARLVVPDGIERDTPPPLSARQQLDWHDTLCTVARIDECLDQPRPVQQNLLHVLRWLTLLEQAQLQTIRGDQLDELLHLIAEATRDDPELSTEPKAPRSMAAIQFRLLAAVYARRDTVADLRQSWKGRARLLGAAIRFARGQGNLPIFQTGQKAIAFRDLEQPMSLPIQSDERLRRLLRVKVQGLHFCGRGYYGIPLIEGFRSLALEYAVILWMSRWLALSGEQTSVRLEDLERAIAIVDHHHGFSPVLGHRGARTRVRLLQQLGAIEQLIRWYGR